jgi:putative phosphoribosyl transferase
VLATRLSRYRGDGDVVVLALPRGGVPVAAEVAAALDAPLDVFVVRKLGMPGHEELAIGAIATGGVVVENEDLVRRVGISREALDAVVGRETVELDRRERAYRHDRPPADVRDRTVIVVDDGLATGSTMRAAVAALGRMDPARVVVAVPTAPRTVFDEMAAVADEVVAVSTPRHFEAVGQWFDDFGQTTDEEVGRLLDEAVRRVRRRA